MLRPRTAVLGTVLIAASLLLVGWTVIEARRQRQATETALTEAATVLAGSLGPGLVAASAAIREFDEIVSWKLLDNARLFAVVGLDGPASRADLERLADDNGLDTLTFLDPSGATEFTAGVELDAVTLAEISEVLAGETEELVVGTSQDPAGEHIVVAVARPAGGSVVASIRASAARTFARRLGVENLLANLVGTGGVLYLAYREEPQGFAAEASWDGAPIPPQPLGDDLGELRGRSVFEVVASLEPLSGERGTLRVGLDGAPLRLAAAAAMRRTLVVGMVLAAFALAATAFAGVNRLRGLEREEAAQRLAVAEAARRGSERLANAGALTAGLAHEVRSPLNTIGLAAQRLERKLEASSEEQSIARRIRQEVARLEGVLREFLELARPVSEGKGLVDLAAISREVCDLLGEEAEACEVGLESPPGSTALEADGGALRRAVINLVRNAIEASPQGGQVRLTLEENSGHVTLLIEDEGSGLEPELGSRAFDAFVTNRASGTGLGLALVRRVAQEHGGSVELLNRPEGGATAILKLPLSHPGEGA